MKKVTDIYKGINCNSGKNRLGYIEHFYDSFFKNKDYKTILEIGCAGGESLRLWESVFPKAKIFGADIVDRFSPAKATKLIGDAYSIEFISQFNDGFFELIIDDVPHTFDSFVSLLKGYYTKLKTGGNLLIEDVIRPFRGRGITEKQQDYLIQLAEEIGFKNIETYDMTGLGDDHMNNVFRSGVFIIKLEK